MPAGEFDRKFQSGEDMVAYCDTNTVRQPKLEQKRVNVDFPVWMIEGLDHAARELGVTRQSLIKFWLAEKLKTSMQDNLKVMARPDLKEV
ncbi:MAG: CopG family transcriptional regulator [Deltaproteobacteria bacterium]|nr:CopG family transcriptional regulator [Deltaproteobacteria bacterium]